MEQGKAATATVRVRCAPVKVHGENSPDVISGKVPLGYRERINAEPSLLEVNYDMAVTMFGKEKADDMFRGIEGD